MPDLAVTSYYENGTVPPAAERVCVLRNNGDGTFGSKIDFGTGAGPWGLTTADFNGDGKADLAVTNYADASVSVLLILQR
jgi:hypothetical protein